MRKDICDIGNGSNLKFHEGAVLLRVAGTYGTVLDVIMEQCQNAIDASAKNIWIEINQSSRTAIVRDDGEGVTRTMFEQALTKVGKSIKKKDKLGRFGLGLISPLGKCERMSFVSLRKGQSRGYLQWEFVSDEIENQEKLGQIPWTERKELVFSRKKKKKDFVNWRTCVRIENYTKDRFKSRLSLELIRDGILDLYGPTIRKKKIVINVKIRDTGGIEKTKMFTADDFSGKQIPRQIISDDDAGEVIFNLFIANVSAGKKRKGKIVLGERDDEFRFPLANLLKTSANCIPTEVANVLKSGVFEGEILAEKCQLQSSRKNFEADDSLLGLCVAIETWYHKFGKKIYEEIQEERAETRYQILGGRSLKVVAGLIKDNPKFKELIKSFKVGTIGDGHAKPDARINGPQDKKSKSIDGSGKKKRRGKGSAKSSKNSKPKGKFGPGPERKEHIPVTGTGPEGKKRTRVYNNSLGIQLSHEALIASSAFWEFNVREGILTINTKHPFWGECAVNDTTLMRYQEFLIIQALNLQLMPEEWRDNNLKYSKELTESYVFMLLNADRLSGRRGGRKSKKSSAVKKK